MNLALTFGPDQPYILRPVTNHRLRVEQRSRSTLLQDLHCWTAALALVAVVEEAAVRLVGQVRYCRVTLLADRQLILLAQLLLVLPLLLFVPALLFLPSLLLVSQPLYLHLPPVVFLLDPLLLSLASEGFLVDLLLPLVLQLLPLDLLLVEHLLVSTLLLQLCVVLLLLPRVLMLCGLGGEMLTPPRFLVLLVR